MNQIELTQLNNLQGECLPDGYNIYKHPSGFLFGSNSKPPVGKMVMKGIYYNNLVRQLSLNNSESIMSQLELVTYQRAEKEVLKPKRWVKIECSPGVLTSTSSDEITFEIKVEGDEKPVKTVSPPEHRIEIGHLPGMTTSTSLDGSTVITGSYEEPTPRNPLADEIFKAFENLVIQELNIHQEFIDLVAKQKGHDRAKSTEPKKEIVMKPHEPCREVFIQAGWTDELIVQHGHADWKPKFKTVTKYVIYSKEGNFFGVYQVIPFDLIPADAQIIPIEVKVPCE